MMPIISRIFFYVMILTLAALQAYANNMPTVNEVTSNKHQIKAWIIEDHYLPIVSMELVFKNTGTAYDPKDKVGLASLTSSLLDEGAGPLDALTFKKTLEAHAIKLSVSSNHDHTYIAVKTLKKNLEKALHLLNIMLTKPHMHPQKVEQVRNQHITFLERSAKEPDTIAEKSLRETLFAGHPYERDQHGSIEGLKAITPDDITEFVSQQYTKDNLVLSIVGDISAPEVSELLDQYLGNLPDQNANHSNTITTVQIPTSGTMKMIDFPVPQDVIIFASDGLPRHNPDFYTLYVLNYIVGGGGFESRLMHEVREKNGLAYGINTSIDLRQASNIWIGSVATRNDASNQTISVIKQTLSDIQKEGITESELNNAKAFLKGSFPLKLTSNTQLARFLSVMQLDHLGMDFLDKRNSYVDAVTLDNINKVAGQMVTPDNLHIVIVGDNK